MQNKRQDSFQSKKTAFAVSIRREYRLNKIRDLRNQFFHVIPQKYTYEAYIMNFELDKDPSFMRQNVLEDDYILIKILLARQENFIRITFKNSSDQNMVDEKLLPPQNSQFELEEVPLPKQYPLALQGALIQAITQNIESEPEKYKKMQKLMQKQLIDFLLRYMKRNTYFETAKEPDYHRILINFMEFFVSSIESSDLRERIIRWVSGTDGFKLISYCLPGTFMASTNYYRLYNLILKGLKHNKMQVRYQAIHVLLKAIQGADYDDIEKILDQIPEIYKELINYFQKMDENDANQYFPDQLEVYQSAKEGGQCIVSFLDTYDEQLIKCVEEGAGYVGGWLIIQNDYHLISIGMTIFNLILDTQNEDLSIKGVQLLLHKQDIKDLKVWQKMGQSYELARHPRVQIRKLFVTFIVKVISNTELEYIKKLNLIFHFPNHETLVEMLIMMFIENEDQTIRYYILQCFQGIFYYSDYIKEELDKDIENKVTKMELETLSIDFIFNRMQNSQMLNLIKEIEKNVSSEIRLKQQMDSKFGELISQFVDYFGLKQNEYNK